MMLACGCGDEEPARADAGPTEDAAPPFEPSEPAQPTPPEPPASPVLTPCPAGWTERTDPGLPEIVTCDP